MRLAHTLAFPPTIENGSLAPMQELTLSQTEAQRLTEEVKADAQRLWAKLLSLYEGGAHIALVLRQPSRVG